jgi:hypothetical protein
MMTAESLVGMPAMAMGGAVTNNTQSSSSTAITNNLKGFMEGATFHIREEADMEKISKYLYRELEIARTQRGGSRNPGMRW